MNKPKKITVAESYTTAVWKEGYKVFFGVAHEILCGAPIDDEIFDKLVATGSFDSMSVGHEHINNFPSIIAVVG